MIGGAEIPEEMSEQLRLHEITAYQSYGMTETISHVALRKIGQESDYHALPGVHFTVDNNCLTIHYPEIQLKAIQTTDVVELLDERTFQWKGRADFVINSGGKNSSRGTGKATFIRYSWTFYPQFHSSFYMGRSTCFAFRTSHYIKEIRATFDIFNFGNTKIRSDRSNDHDRKR